MSTDISPVKRYPPHRFDEAQRREALLALAINGGNCDRTATELTNRGFKITDATLRNWRDNKYPDLYREIHERNRTEIEAALIPKYRDLALLAAEAAQLAVHKSTEALHNGTLKDPAGTARNLATTSAVAMDKLYLATDRPTEAKHDRTAQELLQALETRFTHTIPGTAEDLPDTGLLAEAVVVNARVGSEDR